MRFYVGMQSKLYGYAVSWIDVAQIEAESFSNKYLMSYYLTSVIMFTVGYGDIVAKSIL